MTKPRGPCSANYLFENAQISCCKIHQLGGYADGVRLENVADHSAAAPLRAHLF